jgi:hypothetical protein
MASCYIGRAYNLGPFGSGLKTSISFVRVAILCLPKRMIAIVRCFTSVKGEDMAG